MTKHKKPLVFKSMAELRQHFFPGEYRNEQEAEASRVMVGVAPAKPKENDK